VIDPEQPRLSANRSGDERPVRRQLAVSQGRRYDVRGKGDVGEHPIASLLTSGGFAGRVGLAVEATAFDLCLLYPDHAILFGAS
jgi:hypothetical protein